MRDARLMNGLQLRLWVNCAIHAVVATQARRGVSGGPLICRLDFAGHPDRVT